MQTSLRVVAFGAYIVLGMPGLVLAVGQAPFEETNSSVVPSGLGKGEVGSDNSIMNVNAKPFDSLMRGLTGLGDGGI
jgi:hypothetical protein